MSSELVPMASMELDANFTKTIEVESFIPQIQLLQAQSEVVATPPADASEPPRPGMFWFGKNMSLGRSFEAIPFAARPHALRIKNKKVHSESFKNGSELFKEIEKVAADYAAKNAGDLGRWGADFLMWVPKYQKFGSFFVHSTMRPIIPILKECGGKMVRFTSGPRSNSKGNKWIGADVLVLGAPLPEHLEYVGDPKPLIQKFLTRPDRLPEVAGAPGGSVDR